MLISLPWGHTLDVGRIFSFLELESFSDHILRGVDGGSYLPMRFEMDASGAFHALDPGVV
jgi:hypothetical protein